MKYLLWLMIYAISILTIIGFSNRECKSPEIDQINMTKTEKCAHSMKQILITIGIILICLMIFTILNRDNHETNISKAESCTLRMATTVSNLILTDKQRSFILNQIPSICGNGTTVIVHEDN